MLTASCPAKINLFLEVRDRRPDGYHNLGTLFQTLRCADILSVEPADDLELECTREPTENPEDNLVLKAARLLRDSHPHRLQGPHGARFRLEKVLPEGAGLGGGSSDAAQALRLCNALWNARLSERELHTLGTRLGSDVPFFLKGGTFFGEGRGEILKPAPEPFPFHVVVATPFCRVETGPAYRRLAPKGNFVWKRFQALYMTYCEDPDFYRMLHNDFEGPMRREHAEIEAIFNLLEGFQPVKSLLSGSGSSVFALFRDEAQAKLCLKALEPHCRFSSLTGFVT